VARGKKTKASRGVKKKKRLGGEPLLTRKIVAGRTKKSSGGKTRGGEASRNRNCCKKKKTKAGKKAAGGGLNSGAGGGKGKSKPVPKLEANPGQAKEKRTDGGLRVTKVRIGEKAIGGGKKNRVRREIGPESEICPLKKRGGGDEGKKRGRIFWQRPHCEEKKKPRVVR